MSRYISWSVGSACLWTGGDFFAQFYEAHNEAGARRARGDKREGERPSGGQMLAMLSQERLVQSAVFGAVVGPMTLQYTLLLPRVFGQIAGAASPTLCALAVQQLFVTPALIWAYLNAMTAARGGLSDPSFMAAHTVGASKRHDVWSIERHIFEAVLPFPLLFSWAVVVPLYLFGYLGPFRGMTALGGLIALPWCGSLSYTQSTDLL